MIKKKGFKINIIRIKKKNNIFEKKKNRNYNRNFYKYNRNNRNFYKYNRKIIEIFIKIIEIIEKMYLIRI